MVLVEGHSDRVAIETLARRRGRDLEAEGVEVVAMGGVTNVRSFALRYGPHGLGVPLTGLYDAAEEPIVVRGLAAAGVPADGFFACDADLEDELIRALGADAAEAVVAAAGELRSLQRLTGMPAQRGWSREALLHRFLGGAGRKARYAALFVEALPSGNAPPPLAAVLDRV
ncbi:TOPRIM nucleotidyl transferase/hydrolase domain-containing protein [Nocardioides pyridinolyticus]